jgi:endonuclease YncB( thermonuclease family)
MNKKYSIIFATIITLIIFGDYYILNNNEKSLENAIVGRVIDGDTLKLEDGRTIRLLNINAPEKDFSNSILATNFVKGFENKTLKFEITGVDKYQRYLARIYSPEYINLNLVKLGYASKFLVDENELRDFDRAEKRAIENGLGIWKKSEFYGCFEFNIDKKKEIVKIKNNCDAVSVKGWMLKDESRKTFVFPDISLGETNLHSSSGGNNKTDLFWNAENVWNDDRDSLYLFNDKLEIGGYESYGY